MHMKYLKYPLIILGGIILLYIALCLVGTKDLSMSESIDINASPAVVFNLVNNLQKTESWNAWTLSDTTNIATYNEISEGVGASSQWSGDLNGGGTQKIIESDKNSRVRSEMTFEGWDDKSYAEFLLSPKGNSTQATWVFESNPLPFLFRGFALLSGMKTIMHKMYQEGLINLKRIAEERSMQSLYNGYTIKEIDLPTKYYVMNRQVVSFDKIPSFYTSSLGSLFGKVQQAGIEMDGMPCGLFFNYNESAGTTDMGAAIPVKIPISLAEAISLELPAKRAIYVDYYGDSNNTQPAHYAIEEYMKDKAYLLDYPIIEEYLSDPSKEADPSKWLTRISYYFTEQQ